MLNDPASEGSSSALAGVRVLDLTTNAVAYTGRLLADLGADVIRVAPPDGDSLRSSEPLHFVEGKAVSAAHAFWNANKRSITIDLATNDGRELFARLAGTADIIIESFSPGRLNELGIGYEALRRINPGLILVSVTPFGQSGPCSSYRATDLSLLASGGLLSFGGYPDTSPIAVAGDQALQASAIFGAIAALSALLKRSDTNHGAWIDLSGQECVAFALEDAVPEWYINGRIRRRLGDQAREAGSGVYRCRDGYVSMIAGRLGTAKAFKALVRWIADSGIDGGADLLDPKWEDIAYRQSTEGIERFADVFGRFCASRGKQELYHEGQARQIAIAPVNTLADVRDNAQLRAVGFFREVQDREFAKAVSFPGPPYRLSKTPARVVRPAPLDGEHNYQVFVEEIGLDERELGALIASRVV